MQSLQTSLGERLVELFQRGMTSSQLSAGRLRINMEIKLLMYFSWAEEALGGFHDMDLSMGNVNAWVESFLEAAVVLQEEEETREEDGESLAEETNEDTEETDEEKSCMLSTWRCLSTLLEHAVRHSCRPAGLTRCR